MNDEARQFIESLYYGVTEGWLEITYLTPHKDQWPKTVVDWYELPTDGIDWDQLTSRADRANTAGYGVYYGLAVRRERIAPERRVNGRTGEAYWVYRRGKAADAALVTCLWVDVDKPGPEGLEHLHDATYPPSIIVSSGGGWHGLYLLSQPVILSDEVTRHDVVTTLKGLAVALGGDPAVADLSRIFRLPGYTNTKPDRDNALCTVYDALGAPTTGGTVIYGGSYPFDALRGEYARHGQRQAPAVPRRPLDPKEFEGRLPRRVERFLQSGAPTGSRNKELVYCAMCFKEAGYTLADTQRILGDAGRASGLPEGEVEATIIKGWSRTEAKARLNPRRARRMAAADAVNGEWWHQSEPKIEE